MYKTLPGSLNKPKEEKSPDHHTHSPLFGLNLNLNLSRMISSGVNFFDNLRKKTPSTPTHSNTDSGSLSSPLSISSCSSPALASCGDTESIELTSFLGLDSGVVAVLAGGGTGAGHSWAEVGTQNPTWCDLCGEMIWGLYQTGAWQCELCSYTSHIKCREKVLIDCSNTNLATRDSGSEDEDETDGQVFSYILDSGNSGGGENDDGDREQETETSLLSSPSYSFATARADTLTGSALSQGTNTTRYLSFTSDTDTLVVEDSEDEFHTMANVSELADTCAAPPCASLLALPPSDLARLLSIYNSLMPGAQPTCWDPDLSAFSGYIRVEMNLARPINVISGTRPPSIYNIMQEDTINDRTLTTFYLPPGTEKALHITSQTTTQDVIRVLLKKFRVADNPHKYALYERRDGDRRESFPRSKSLSRLKLRRMTETEKPLVKAILWGQHEDHEDGEGEKSRRSSSSSSGEEVRSVKFVLQENDPGEIQWDRFSLPELKNFLLILDREEAWYKRRIHEKYENIQDEMHKLLLEKRPEPV